MAVDLIFLISESVSKLAEPIDVDKVAVTFYPGSCRFQVIHFPSATGNVF